MLVGLVGRVGVFKRVKNRGGKEDSVRIKEKGSLPGRYVDANEVMSGFSFWRR